MLCSNISINPDLKKRINMVKDLFGRWKKEEAIMGYDYDHQQPEGKIILERMASIMTSDEANNKDSQGDIRKAPEAPLSDPLIVIERFEVQEPLEIETSEEYLSAKQNSGNEYPHSDKVNASDKSEIVKPKLEDELISCDKGSISEENSTVRSANKMEKESPMILVVEDEPVTQRLIKMILEGRGYGVVIAGDGIEALIELGKGDFDLILSDLSMPNLDGFKLLDFINMKGIKAPIIFLTGSDDVEDEIKVLALGAKDYVRKPINRDLLLLRIGKVLISNSTPRKA